MTACWNRPEHSRQIIEKISKFRELKDLETTGDIITAAIILKIDNNA